MIENSLDCLVIGGGISGLIAAYELSKSGNDVLLLEASDRLGGSISTIELNGFQVDSGAESFAISRNTTLELISELGLSSKVVNPARSDARIIANGKTCLIPHGLMGIPSDLDSKDVIEILGLENAMAAKELDSGPWNIDSEKTIGDIVEKRMGAAVVVKIVNPIVAGVHASDSYKLEMQSLLPELLPLAEKLGCLQKAVKQIRESSGQPGSAISGLCGGMAQIISRLAEVLMERGVKIQKNSLVSQVSYSVEEKVWKTVSMSAVFLSKKIVVALPPHQAALIMSDFPELASRLGAIKAVDVALVLLAVRADELAEEPLGSGVLIATENSNVRAKASTHATAKWGWLREEMEGVEIIRLSYGRNGVLPKDLEILKKWGEEDLVQLYGLSKVEILDSKIVSWPKSLIQAGVGHQENLNQIAILSKQHPNLVFVGAGFGGNGITGIISKTREEIRLLEMESASHE